MTTAPPALELVLYYNSQAGVAYFQVGAFGSQLDLALLRSARTTRPGIIAVDRPDGRELEFRAPLLGHVFSPKDADVNDTLERLTAPAATTAAGA